VFAFFEKGVLAMSTTYTHTHALAHTHTHAHAHGQQHTHTHAHIHTHKPTQTRAHTHTILPLHMTKTEILNFFFLINFGFANCINIQIHISFEMTHLQKHKFIFL